MIRLRRGVAAAVALLLVGVACSGSDDELDLGPPDGVTRPADDADSSDADVPTRAGQTFHVAQAVDSQLVVRASPQDSADVIATLATTDRLGGSIVCLVNQELGDNWVQVVLPTSAAGRTGWVARDDVTLTRHRFRIEVARGRHTLTVYSGDDVALTAPVALGPDAPPAGARLFVTDLVRPATGTVGPYGAYAYDLSGPEPDLAAYLSGTGVVAVHGTTDAATLGGDAPQGSIAVDGAVVSEMVDTIGLPLGTPVDVVP
jgi:lipoprotein-anchoring transpeptidase ErfK/SrfK